ncbi:leucyl/phenylalanyl-tRNA--protein transferase [Spirulina subsalsa]|uniref:leucyl/phenylalanyl-tRNA--protein transferase n=1 Tax=Spirulina subsalsa TaxID=54311 RepID=UPI00031DD2AA|nr:leucyl/phenylalanyl-tRNA--protein transferase [Spirulina subsalsa]
MDFQISSLIEGYSQGYFLMADEKGELGWYSSRQRAIVPLDGRFRYPKSLRRVLNQNRFTTAINRDFKGVCEGCAARETTWISEDLQALYWQLHLAGWAHSFETWEGDKLAGGILGIAIRGLFVGESMFYRIPDGSKVAMVRLVEHLRRRGFQVFDAQLQNPHLERFGTVTVTDRDYQILLQKAIATPCRFL